MNVRCKFQLQEVHHLMGDLRRYIFRPQYDPDIPEDQRFHRYSPWGEFSISVDNPAVHQHYVLGAHYYFDSTPVSAVASETKETGHE